MKVIKKPLYPGLEAEKARRGHSTAEVARILGISTDAERRRENGSVEYSLPEIKKLMSCYGRTFDELFATDTEPDRRNSA
jgi:transcriptional regulator with XRE-family HTH domain